MLRCSRRLWAIAELPVSMSGLNTVPVVPIVQLPLPPKAAPQPQQHTLVLDIDETLITFPRTRPHLKDFLRATSEMFEVVIWTAGTKEYCELVMDAIEDHSGLPRRTFTRLARYHTLEELNWMKFLPLLGRPADSVLMIDDNERSFPLTPRNGVRIRAFDGVDAADRSLMDLLPMLEAVAKAPNARAELDHWRPDEYETTDFLERNLDVSTFERRMLGNVAPRRRAAPIAPQVIKNEARRQDARILRRMDDIVRKHWENIRALEEAQRNEGEGKTDE